MDILKTRYITFLLDKHITGITCVLSYSNLIYVLDFHVIWLIKSV